MNQDSHALAAEMLAISAPAYAAYASNRLLESFPESRLKLGDQAFGHWKDHFSERIRELSAALAENQPVLFVARVRWSQVAFASRKVPEALLRESLVCLNKVLQEELPRICGDAPSQFVSQAIQSLSETCSTSADLQATDPVAKLALQYMQKVLEGNGREALQLVVDAHQKGMSLANTYQALMMAQREIGRMWHQSEVNIAEEHYVTLTTERTMSVLAYQAERQPARAWTVVAAAVAHNSHDLGVRAVSDFFEFDGWRAVCMGGDLPAKDIADAVQFFSAHLVLLSATLTTQLKAVREAIEAIRTAKADCRIMVGGPAFFDAPDLWRQLGADGYAESPLDAVRVANQLMDSSATPLKDDKPVN